MTLTFMETAGLGAFAGMTIYLGLPVGKLSVSRRTTSLLNAGAIGVLVFLLFEILHKAVEPVEAGLTAGRLDVPIVAAFVGGLLVGSVGLAWFNDQYVGVQPSSRQLTVMIAAGIGLHNFSEGLAIGQAAASGAISFALLLVIGFALHNVTEGFGIAAPLSGDDTSYAFLGGLGLLGGGPVLLGTLIGQAWTSTVASVLFLSLAGGALINVIYSLSRLDRPNVSDTAVFAAIAVGFLAGLGTEIVLEIGMLG